MAVMTHDMWRSTRTVRIRRTGSSRVASGLVFAMVSAASFGMSGSLARGLLDAGWTAGAATLVRVAIAALVLVVPGALALRGRWHLLRRGWAVIVAYGVFAVAGAQLCYFIAVGYLDVSVALLIEYTAPVAVVLWMWMRHGNRPTRLTVAGALIAAAGLVLLLDVLGGGASVNLVGVAWALAAMVGASVYFVIGGDESNGLPGMTLAAGGLLVALVVLAAAALAGVLPIAWSTDTVQFVPFAAPWWAVALVLGIVTAATAYVTGIAATRRLGARLGSFVALTEVMMATLFAWLLLGQVPVAIQVAGALLVVAGVVVVKLGERPAETVIDSIEQPPATTDSPAPIPV
ncbi:DMT family transporter [Demequina sp. NBRC 110053]|uniref:EamA family transporter n=1 Tax=Demequina sp. NBRC 110053 TaxID=1570342 RepID=UPI0009FEAB64|nr:DMT family transporter [Demequina sp. NBRC 110053]